MTNGVEDTWIRPTTNSHMVNENPGTTKPAPKSFVQLPDGWVDHDRKTVNETWVRATTNTKMVP